MKRSRLSILLFLAVAAGCHRHPRGTATVQPPVAPAKASTAIPSALVEAEAAFGRREYLSSAVAFESFFQSGATSSEMDRLRFHFGVAQSLSGIADLERASSETFQQLINDYPESSYTPAARMALSLRSDITRLQADKVSQEDKIRQLNALLPSAPPVLPPALAEAESAYDAGDFATAAKSYEVYLQSKPQTEELDRILLRYGISQSLSGTAAREAASNDTFKQLIRDFPNSPYASSAGRVLGLRQEILQLKKDELKAKDDAIKKLTDELDTIKKLDVGRPRTSSGVRR